VCSMAAMQARCIGEVSMVQLGRLSLATAGFTRVRCQVRPLAGAELERVLGRNGEKENLGRLTGHAKIEERRGRAGLR
jgi:hypothetical protein